MIKAGSDFSGVGAFDQAMKRVFGEFETVFACDMDKFARQSFISNYGEPKYYPENVYEREIPTEPLDVYMTSPPCQSFSLAGKRKGKDSTNGVLFFNSHEFIQVNKPRFFIFENVKGLLSDDDGKTFSEWCNMLGGKSINGLPVLFPYEDSVPYHIYWKVLNSEKHGVPQNRERVFIVGIRDDENNLFTWPKEEPLTKKLKDVLESDVDSKYFLSEKTLSYMLEHKEIHKERGNGFAFNVRDITKPASAISTKAGSRQTDNYIKIKSATKKGYEEATENDSINFTQPSSETRRGRVGKGVAQTLDTACNQAVIQDRIRRLTPIEAFRLQDFPDSFINTINNNNNINKQGILCIFEEKGLWKNAKEMGVIDFQPQKGSVLCTIKDSKNMGTKIIFSNTHIEKIENVQSRIVINQYTHQNSAHITTILKDNTETPYLFSKKENGYELIKSLKVKDGEKMDKRSIEQLLKITLSENLNQGSAFTISTVIPIIIKLITYLYSEVKPNTIGVIINYKELPDSCITKESLVLKTANTSLISDSQLYKQAGNSITVRVLELILQKIKNCID